MKNITSNSSKELIILENAVNYLNEKLFDNKLSKIKVTIQKDTNKNKTYGWACYQSWSDGKNLINELNITANSLKRPFKEIWVTLVHELIHLYGNDNGIQTTSRQGRYHNKEFKKLCDKFYLITEKNESIGYTTPHCKLLKEQQELYKDFTKKNKNINTLFKFQRLSFEKESAKKEKTTSQYICPDCGTKFTAKKGLNIICGVCDIPFEEQE